MIRSQRTRHAPACALLLAAIVFIVCSGCQTRRAKPIRLYSDVLGPLTIAVAPADNVSGVRDFDSARVADLMAEELTYVEGFQVIPVNRVIAVLTDQGRKRIESPEHALEVIEILGADALLVFAITEYDPYEPPVVGIAAQVYGHRRSAGPARFEPVRAARSPTPARLADLGAPSGPLAQAQFVFDASHEWVSQEVRRFARARSADRSAFGWRKYLAVQQQYLRFCCHTTVRALIGDDPRADDEDESDRRTRGTEAGN